MQANRAVSIGLSLTIGIVLSSAVGCANYTRPIAAAPKLTEAERNFQAYWRASQEVLRRHYFRIDRRDRRAGVIATLPMTGKVFGEFWRHDAATETDLTESTMQTIYRAAVVTIRRTAPDADTFDVSVEVSVSRSNRAHVQVTSTSEAYSLFVLPGGEGNSKRSVYLVDYGQFRTEPGITDLEPDKALAAKIAAAIRAEAGARPKAPTTRPATAPAPAGP